MTSYNLTTLVTFTGPNGATPTGSLIADRAGNLYGTTALGGTGNGSGNNTGDGTVFEVLRDANSPTGYGTTITLATFGGSADTGLSPAGSLLTDAAGNLYGTTVSGNSNLTRSGTVFEIQKAASGIGYDAVATLVTFGTGAATGINPYGSLVADGAGNLYGTTALGGANGLGTVFEIPKATSGNGYGAAFTLVSFDSSGGFSLVGSLAIDAAGNLYGTTSSGRAVGGTVFEIPKTSGSTGYGAVSILATFSSGASPLGSLTFDAAGNLYGTTSDRGASAGHGTVFQIPKDTAGPGYGTARTLVDFTNTASESPFGSLTIDSAGNLYGTTAAGGTSGGGTAFEVPVDGTTSTGYGTATILVDFAKGDAPHGDLLADGAGNFYGTTSGLGDPTNTTPGGTVFKLSLVVAGGGGAGGGGGGAGSDGTVSTTPTSGPDNIPGTAGDDTIAALAGDDTVDGLGGNDVLLGNQGDDQIRDGDGDSTIAGGLGNDRIAVGNGANLLYGNEGSDTIAAGSGNDTILGGSGDSLIDSLDGADLITAGDGDDLILGNGGDDTVVAGGGADTVLGGWGRDVLLGNRGDDVILGNQGNDTLFGGQGGDTLVGGMGDDVLYGNEGDDVLYGNEGLNTFVFASGDTDFQSRQRSGDTVMDFVTGMDRIDFTSGPAGGAANFGAGSTTAKDFASAQAVAQGLIDSGDVYAFVANGTDGYLFTTGGTGTAITDAVKLAGAGTTGALRFTDIDHGALA